MIQNLDLQNLKLEIAKQFHGLIKNWDYEKTGKIKIQSKFQPNK